MRYAVGLADLLRETQRGHRDRSARGGRTVPPHALLGVLLGGAPELVRLDEVRPAVYRVAWSLSSAASGRLRRRPPV